MFCSQCGSENLLHVKFCSKCGNNLGLSGDKFQQALFVEKEIPKEPIADYEGRLETDTNVVETVGTPSQKLIHDYVDQKKYFNKRRLIYILFGVLILALALFFLVEKRNSNAKKYEIKESETTNAAKEAFIQTPMFVHQERAYLYNQPSENTRQKAYCIIGDIVTAKDTSGDWVMVTYTENNIASEGWMHRADLTEEIPAIELQPSDISSSVDWQDFHPLMAVVTEKAYFYETAESSSMTYKYCIKGDEIAIEKNDEHWVYAAYFDGTQVTKGFMKKEDLSRVSTIVEESFGEAKSLVDGLRVRLKPGMSESVLYIMQKGEKASYVGFKTSYSTIAIIKDKEHNEPWFYLRINDDIKGWVHGCCLEITFDTYQGE